MSSWGVLEESISLDGFLLSGTGASLGSNLLRGNFLRLALERSLPFGFLDLFIIKWSLRVY